MAIGMSYNNGVMTLFVKGRPFQAKPEDAFYSKVQELLKLEDNEDALYEVLTKKVVATPKPVAAPASVQIGKVLVQGGEVYYDGIKVHHAIADRIKLFLTEGYPIEPLMRHLEKFLQNPSFASREEGFDFAQNKNLAIHEDGDLLCYKAVGMDWYDLFSRSDEGRRLKIVPILNKPGCVVEIDRDKVDDNRSVDCSHGLHVGAMDYVTKYGGWQTDDRNFRIIIVKVNPRDIVSVPKGHNFMKMRVCRYEVVSEYQSDLTKNLYKGQETLEVHEAVKEKAEAPKDTWVQDVKADAPTKGKKRYFTVNSNPNLAYVEGIDGSKEKMWYIRKDGTRSHQSVFWNVDGYIGEVLRYDDERELTQKEAFARLDSSCKQSCGNKHCKRDANGKFCK